MIIYCRYFFYPKPHTLSILNGRRNTMKFTVCYRSINDWINDSNREERYIYLFEDKVRTPLCLLQLTQNWFLWSCKREWVNVGKFWKPCHHSAIQLIKNTRLHTVLDSMKLPIQYCTVPYSFATVFFSRCVCLLEQHKVKQYLTFVLQGENLYYSIFLC